MNDLAVDRAELIGRERDLGAVLMMLETARVVTLCGPGGVGKTRLAHAIVERLSSARAMPVQFVDLSNVIDAEDAGDAVLRAIDACCNHPGRSVMVLDNCEHVLEAVRHTVETAVTAHPFLRVLATSRVPIDSILEATYVLHPLAADAAQALFVRHVRAFDPEYDPRADGADIAAICARLEGLPLAIELAAPRARVLGVRRLAQRLTLPSQLLSGKREAARAPRQQSLRALIAWSFDLLDEPERRAMGQLSVFAGWFSLEAAREVCADALRAGIVTTVLRLREKSLLTHDGERYYRMLEPIREFAAEELRVAGGAGEFAHRHARFCTAFAQRGYDRLKTTTPAELLRRLDAFHDNVRAALAWALEYENDVELGVDLVLAYTQFWIVRGFLTEGRRWVGRALAKLGEVQTRPHARLSRAAGKLARQQGDTSAAIVANRAAVAFYASLPQQSEELADALNGLALALHESGALDEAEATYARALEIERAVGDERGVAMMSNNLAGLLLARGAFADGARALRNVPELFS